MSYFKDENEKYLQLRIDVFESNKIFIKQNNICTVDILDILKNRQDEIVK